MKPNRYFVCLFVCFLITFGLRDTQRGELQEKSQKRQQGNEATRGTQRDSRRALRVTNEDTTTHGCVDGAPKAELAGHGKGKRKRHSDVHSRAATARTIRVRRQGATSSRKRMGVEVALKSDSVAGLNAYAQRSRGRRGLPRGKLVRYSHVGTAHLGSTEEDNSVVGNVGN